MSTKINSKMIGKVIVSMSFLAIPTASLFFALEKTSSASHVSATSIDMQYIEYTPINDDKRCQLIDREFDPELYQSLC